MRHKKKLSKLFFLYPNNISLMNYFNSFLLLGSFNLVNLNWFNYSKGNLLIGLERLSLLIGCKSTFNILILESSKSNFNLFNSLYLINVFYFEKLLFSSFSSYISMLRVFGIGYKVQKKNNTLYFSLGYSHSLLFNTNLSVFIKPIKNSYLFLTSSNSSSLMLETKYYTKLKKKDVYKGKGVLLVKKKVKLRVGKKD